MKSNLSRTRNMYQVVINILQSFVLLWTTYVPFSDAVTSFKNNIEEIDETKMKQQEILSGYTINKREKKKNMATLGSIISKKVRGWCADVGDRILFNKMKISFTKMYRKRDTESIGFAELIYETANAMAPLDRTKYKISDEDLETFRDAIDTFKNLSSPEQVRAIRKQLTESLPPMFKQTTAILTDKIDNFMSEYQQSDPDFYDQYNNARRTYESHRHTTVEGTAVDETTGADLSQVQVIISSSSETFEELTDAQGNFKKQIEPEINYTVKFVLPEYEPVEFENINLNRGEHEKLIAILKKIN